MLFASLQAASQVLSIASILRAQILQSIVFPGDRMFGLRFVCISLLAWVSGLTFVVPARTRSPDFRFLFFRSAPRALCPRVCMCLASPVLAVVAPLACPVRDQTGRKSPTLQTNDERRPESGVQARERVARGQQSADAGNTRLDLTAFRSSLVAVPACVTL